MTTSKKHPIPVLTGREIDALQNISLIAISQRERAGMDASDLRRAVRKLAQSKDRREIEIPEERLEILHD